MTSSASWRLRLLPPVVVVVAVAGVFLPVLGFSFLNWDDGPVIVDNASLVLPDGVWWAATTTHMEHYQPLSWLAWAITASLFEPAPGAFHAVNAAAHALAALLLLVVARQVLARALPDVSREGRDAWSIVAALLFALHPLRVEVAAWVSAMPYALGLVLALAATAAWLRASAGRESRSLLPALALFIASLLARPAALGLPVVLVALDMWLNRRSLRRAAVRAVPFVAVSLLAAIAEGMARAPILAEVPWLYRLQLATTAPFVYLWRTLAPIGLTPLDVLPRVPAASALTVLGASAALAAVSASAWRWRHRWPGLLAAWVAYLALLAPAAGLVPSGLQATADRYTYVPGVVLAVALAGAGAAWARAGRWRGWAVAAVAGGVLVALAAGARAALEPWRDSVSLWSHAVDVNPSNDVALYNLGTALTDAGRPEDAAARYREALALNPGYVEARANLDRLDAGRLEREGNDLAAAGDLLAAADRYRQALERDPGRTHAHAALGMALVSLGRHEEARTHLEEARRQGNSEAAVANALGVLLAQAGQTREARVVLESGLATHRNDVGLAMNLTQVLLSSSPAAGGDPVLALRLATAVDEATGGRDPRIVETLAAALAANGRLDEARSANARAVQLARTQGDEELAVQIAARGRAYRNPGP